MKVGDLVQVKSTAMYIHGMGERVGVVTSFAKFGSTKTLVVYIEDENGIQYVYRPESLRVIA